MKRKNRFKPNLGDHKALHIFVDAAFYRETRNGAYGAIYSSHPNPPKKDIDKYILTTLRGYIVDVDSSGDAELQGILHALYGLEYRKDLFKEYKHLVMYTDSLQVKGEIYHYAYTDEKREPKKNIEVWEEIRKILTLLHAQQYQTLNFNWVKGHNGTLLNEMCDKMAKNTYGGKNGITK